MFFVVGISFLALLSITLFMLWAHEKMANKKITPRAEIEECWHNEERRANKRFEKELEVEYTVEKKPHMKNGMSLNISKGGMKLLLDDKLLPGTIITLKMRSPQTGNTVDVEAEVIWTKDVDEKKPLDKRFFNSGIKFIAIKEASYAGLIDILNG